ncbi:MAG: hypothetical protein M5T61_05535 [Acidimicrobiia bacterium]|nr:hypothetical protein [Acidimicrobiia bacterium]
MRSTSPSVWSPSALSSRSYGPLVVAAAAAWFAYGVPHVVYHSRHTAALDGVDAAALLTALTFSAALALFVLVLPSPRPPPPVWTDLVARAPLRSKQGVDAGGGRR